MKRLEGLGFEWKMVNNTRKEKYIPILEYMCEEIETCSKNINILTFER